MNRRDLLAAAAAAPALALTGTATGAEAEAEAEAETPIAALFREWEVAHRAANSGTLPDAEAEAASDRMFELDKKMMHQPSLSAADLLMKIAAFTAWGDFAISDCPHAKADIIWNEMRGLTGVQA